MSTVLLLLAPDRYTLEATTRAAEAAARAEVGLRVVYVIDPTEAERVQQKVREAGFMGESACEELRENLREEYTAQGQEAINEVQAVAQRAGCTCTGSVLCGPFVEIALDQIAQAEAAQVVVARRPGSRLRRLVRGSDLEALQQATACPITIVEPMAQGPA